MFKTVLTTVTITADKATVVTNSTSASASSVELAQAKIKTGLLVSSREQSVTHVIDSLLYIAVLGRAKVTRVVKVAHSKDGEGSIVQSGFDRQRKQQRRTSRPIRNLFHQGASPAVSYMALC
jgi:hypothetical protein